ncbi:MAG: preprotein translocase subunit SecA [Fimbriimonadaceae bacterium]
MQLLRKLFFDTSEKDVKAILPVVDQINALEPEMEGRSDEQLQKLSAELRDRAMGGESLDSLLPEAFALVRETSKRMLGMRQFDVQMIGGVVLHRGRIAEMKTGEGKTLVAVAPLYLNALTGQGAHLVTVNDYLARRDATWMGPIYDFLGLSVGIIQGQSADSDELGGSYRYTPGAVHEDPRYMNLTLSSRRDAYLCDIVYGTNHEFGFDYLRDNMAFQVDQLVMRQLNYAVVDEVDSILIDEARTPHIISGPSQEDVSVYNEVDKVIRNLDPESHYTADRKNRNASFTEEGMDFIEEEFGVENIASEPRLFHHAQAALKAYALFQKDVDYVVRNGEVVIVDENTGRMMIGRRYSDGLHQALEAKERVQVQRESQTVATITFQNLFRLYDKLAGMTGTAKTEEDEFRKIYGLDVVCVPTHRPMRRVDHPDVVYKTADAKMRAIAWEILRVHVKEQPVLVGTRSIEMSEVVSNRLTPEMLQKLILVMRLRAEVEKGLKGNEKSEGEALVNTDLKELKLKPLSQFMATVGLPSNPLDKELQEWAIKLWNMQDIEGIEERLDDCLRHGVPHNVLNAKYHEREALIIAEAGRKAQVTIATNMAGRGVDILLGGRVEDEQVQKSREGKGDLAFEAGDEEHHEYAKTFASFRRGGKERAAPPLPLSQQERSDLAEEVRELGGLYILGTERHESRRIDNQLRGRAGRQGDPGESRFYVSLEDMLWKIFNEKMLENPMLKAWPPMEEVNNKMVSNMIRKTQERIESHFFEARKHVLEYDDVLNAQREHIYGMRRDVLLGKPVREDLLKSVDHAIDSIVQKCFFIDEKGNQGFDDEMLYNELNEIFPLIDYASAAELEQVNPGPEMTRFCQDLAHRAYMDKVAQFGEETFVEIEKNVMLQVTNEIWMEHLQMIDYIREGIGLRGYGQTDPLMAYKRETYELFKHTLTQLDQRSMYMIFRVQPVQQSSLNLHMKRVQETPPEPTGEALPAGSANGAATAQPGAAVSVKEADSGEIDWKRVGRNDPCPCGSGKKFKACHYSELRAKGVI